MCYIHDMKVVHYDQKPTNIILISIDVIKMVDLSIVHIKLDFGISKAKVKNTSQVCTWVNVGSIGDMVHEVRNKNMDEKSLLEIDALKADVFSLNMMYNEIILRIKTFSSKCFLYTY